MTYEDPTLLQVNGKQNLKCLSNVAFGSWHQEQVILKGERSDMAIRVTGKVTPSCTAVNTALPGGIFSKR